ncbi:MAG: DUF433 domain-containing protein [Pirellulales bacterium]
MAAQNDWQQRIIANPTTRQGEACIRGTRVPVSVIVGSIAEGDSWEQVLASYPQLAHEDIRAALLYAAEAVSRFELIPLAD